MRCPHLLPAAAFGLAGLIGVGVPQAQASLLPALTPAVAQAPYAAAQLPAASVQNGQEIFARFRDGLANPQCDRQATSPRWQQQFRHAAHRLADPDDDLLPLFGYVVDQLRAEGLPTEFALIPFIESGYRPGARSSAGPAGLWQFIGTTARNHRVPMGAGLDGRLSASESTAAAVSYLKTLYGMFGGRWELALMGYNAGEYRILQALRRAGVNAGNATPDQLAGLSPITYSYVEKVHALSCVLEDAADNGQLMARLDRNVPVLHHYELPQGTALAQWASSRQLDPAALTRLNPLARSRAPGRGLGVLAPRHADDAGSAPSLLASAAAPAPAAPDAGATTSTTTAAASAPTQATATAGTTRHRVRAGESLWAIARRHGIPLARLLASNGLDSKAVLRPGMELLVERP